MAAVSDLALTNPRGKKMASISELRFEGARRGAEADRTRLRSQLSCIREWEEPCPEPAPPYSCGVRADWTPHLRHRRQVQLEMLPLTSAPVDPCSLLQRADADLQKHSPACPLLSHTRTLDQEDGLPPHKECLTCLDPCAEVAADIRERWLNSWRAKLSANHSAFCSLEDDVSPPEAGLLGKPTSVQTPEMTSKPEAPILPDDTIEAESAEACVDVTDDLTDSTGDQYKRWQKLNQIRDDFRPSLQIFMKKGTEQRRIFYLFNSRTYFQFFPSIPFPGFLFPPTHSCFCSFTEKLLV